MNTDPYRYFRIEVREILDDLSPGVLRLEREGGDTDLEQVTRLMRLVHTLKGAAGVVGLGGIVTLAHEMEDVLASYRSEPRPISADDIASLLQCLDDLEAEVTRLHAPSRPSAPIADVRAPKTSAPGQEEVAAAQPEVADVEDDRLHSIRVAISQMDDFIAGLVETSVEVVGLDSLVEDLHRTEKLIGRLKSQLMSVDREDGYGLTLRQVRERSQAILDEAHGLLGETRRALADRAKRITWELATVRQDAADMRLVPVSALRSVLERAVRDAASTRKKHVEFALVGGETHLDAGVLAGVREALLHLVRNAVAHGIEAPGDRLAAGKPNPGLVEVRVERNGKQVTLICADDGRGVDCQAVGRIAAERGLLSSEQAQALSVDDAIDLLLKGAALTTSSSADSLSGRGIGLDIVRRTAARLNGRLAVESRTGEGTRVRLTVPVSVAVTSVLMLRDGSIVGAIPIQAVARVVAISSSEIIRSPTGDAIAISDGEIVPFARFGSLLGGAGESPRGRWTAVLVDSVAGRAVVAGDRVMGIEEVIVRPLPDVAQVDEVVAGGFLDANGQPRLVIDPAALVEATQAARAPVMQATSTKRARTVLVIDDSLTTRMLEQSILETAGYRVDLAASGEDGLKMAREKDYGIFLVDVEMPGIDGFEFIEITRRDARLREVPAILVTSRKDPADRRRGIEVGAAAYIVKGEFEQSRLLAEIERLMKRADTQAEASARSKDLVK